MRKAFLAVGVCVIASCVASACMTRPVTSTEPQTSNLYVEPVRNDAIDKLDLLFMIDNSQSMGDKQKLLALAVPQLVERLVVPRCVNGNGEIRERTNGDETCPDGFVAEFRAVRDIHVAVITSSLGAHGAASSSCSGGPDIPHGDDHGYLLPKVRPGTDLPNYNNSGFLAWDPDQKLVPPGQRDAGALGMDFGKMVEAAGEQGCGFEASLESWYRFLIDPEPPLAVTVENELSTVKATDQQVLDQRAAFLRPDSLVAIVMLTDENDCSVRDEASGFFLANQNARMVRANSACAKDPNDPCCAPCKLSPLPDCPSIADDPACKLGPTLSKDEDNPNLRCLENKRRFGYDFLYPTQRYIDGLTQDLVPRRSDGMMVENPLFVAPAGKLRRDKSLVFLAGIVGVPWQDIADPASLTGSGLRYLSALELANSGRWDVLVGDRAKNVPPSDPFMREGTAPRSGTNPVTGDAIAPETSTNPRASAMNGHEQVDHGDDLQYACTFPLALPEACDGGSCDCEPASGNEPGPVARNRPLCQPPGGGPAGTTQYFGKAYPGIRPLEVLKGIGESAIVASICPKVLTKGEPGFGYEPAVDAIVDRLKVALTGRCLPRPLAVEAQGDGKLPCVVVEALPPTDDCGCSAARRKPASAEASQLVRREMAERKQCGTATTPACASFCMCELAAAEDDAVSKGLTECLNDEAGSSTPGYCYVNPYGESPQGNPALVKDCEYGKPLLRFVGPNTPTNGANAFIACLGATVH